MPAYEYFSDEQLSHAAHQDDLDAWDALLRRHGQRLLAYLDRLCGDEALARELWERVWTELWSRRGQQAAESNAVLAAFSLATASALRAASARPRRSPEAEGGDLSSLSARAQRLRQALLAVPPRERAALALCYLDNLSFVDAGRVLNASAPEAKELCAEGYAQLSVALGLRFLEEGLP